MATKRLRTKDGSMGGGPWREHRPAERKWFGARIKEVRLARLIPVTNLCEKIGITRASYYAWENGDVVPRLENQEMFAKVCRIPLDYLDPDKKDKYTEMPMGGDAKVEKAINRGLTYLGPDSNGNVFVTFSRRMTTFQMNHFLKWIARNFADDDQFVA